jgi:hypothetical protein
MMDQDELAAIVADTCSGGPRPTYRSPQREQARPTHARFTAISVRELAMRMMVSLLLALPLSGCLSDQEQHLAQCRSSVSRAQKPLGPSTAFSDEIVQIETCMRTAGYEPDRTDEQCLRLGEIAATLTGRCYQPTNLVGWLARKIEIAWSG